MNQTIIKILAVLGLIGSILGLVFSFLPISNLAVFPAIIGLLLGLIAFSASKKNGQNFTFPRIVVVMALIAIAISVGKQLLFENKVTEDTEFIQKTEKSEQDAVKDIEGLDEELGEELDGLE